MAVGGMVGRGSRWWVIVAEVSSASPTTTALLFNYSDSEPISVTQNSEDTTRKLTHMQSSKYIQRFFRFFFLDVRILFLCVFFFNFSDLFYLFLCDQFIFFLPQNVVLIIFIGNSMYIFLIEKTRSTLDYLRYKCAQTCCTMRHLLCVSVKMNAALEALNKTL